MKLFKKIAVLALALCLVAVSAFAATIKTTSGANVNVRAGAGTNYSVVGKVADGANVTVLKTGANWTQIKVDATGLTGYISTKFIRSTAKVWVSKDGGSLKLRAGAGTNTAVAGYVQHGDAITVGAKTGEWSNVTVAKNGKTGYIKTKYVSFDSTSGGEITFPSNPGTATASAYDAARLSTKTAGGQVNLRQGASSSTKSLGSLSRGAFLKVTGKDGNWYQVVTEKGVSGYVYKDYVAFGVSAKTTGNVNFRTGAGTSNSVIRTLATGTTVTVNRVDGKWANVTCDGKTGFISVSYFKY